MAAAVPGSLGNAEWGFVPSSTSTVTIGAGHTSVGFLQGDVSMSIPREYAFLTLDQAVVDLSGVLIHRSLLIDFAMGEVLLANLQTAWDNQDATVNVDHEGRGTVELNVNTLPPNQDGSDTRGINCPTALAIGDGAYAITNARGGAPQSLGAQFKAIADSSALLATITDTYA